MPIPTPLPPGAQRDELLRSLRATRQFMMSPLGLMKIRRATPAERQHAAEDLLRTQIAILDLETQALGAIRKDLEQNSVELQTSANDLALALEGQKRLATILSAISGFLNVVAKVVTVF